MKEETSKKGEEYFAKAMAAKNAGRFKVARAWFIKAAPLMKGKGRSACWVFAGYCNKELGDLPEALRSLKNAERYQPKSAFIQRYVGEIKLHLDRPKLAERALRKSISLKPSAIAFIFLGSSLDEQNNVGGAKACYQKALRLEPDNEEGH